MNIVSLGSVTVILWLGAVLWLAAAGSLTKGRLLFVTLVVPFWPVPYGIVSAIAGFVIDVLLGIAALAVSAVVVAIGIPWA
ncbi:hypothetical protein VB779_05310 [Haloarculaceae archaeon H-GB11]|nr:hypothetical protein [Haloarculaceae archaeon H-GB11]